MRGNGRGVLLAGIAGVGKTRLASEVERRLKAKWSVVVLHATRAMGGFTFGAFAPLLTSDDNSASAQSQTRVLRDSILALERVSGGRPTLLVVDDVQWLDDGSAVLLAQLVTGGHVKVLLTQRTGETVPDAVQALWKDQRIDRIDLGRLDSDSIYKLVDATLDGPADSIATHELERISQGNPLYLRELLRSTLDSGRLRKVGDRGRLDDGRLWMGAETTDDAAGHAERLSELIGQSMAGLATGQRLLLEMVAFAEPLPLAWIESAEHAEDLHQLERRNLLAIDGHALRPRNFIWHIRCTAKCYALRPCASSRSGSTASSSKLPRPTATCRATTRSASPCGVFGRDYLPIQLPCSAPLSERGRR